MMADDSGLLMVVGGGGCGCARRWLCWPPPLAWQPTRMTKSKEEEEVPLWQPHSAQHTQQPSSSQPAALAAGLLVAGFATLITSLAAGGCGMGSLQHVRGASNGGRAQGHHLPIVVVRTIIHWWCRATAAGVHVVAVVAQRLSRFKFNIRWRTNTTTRIANDLQL